MCGQPRLVELCEMAASASGTPSATTRDQKRGQRPYERCPLIILYRDAELSSPLALHKLRRRLFHLCRYHLIKFPGRNSGDGHLDRRY
jgi:hypothetical protein